MPDRPAARYVRPAIGETPKPRGWHEPPASRDLIGLDDECRRPRTERVPVEGPCSWTWVPAMRGRIRHRRGAARRWRRLPPGSAAAMIGPPLDPVGALNVATTATCRLADRYGRKPWRGLALLFTLVRGRGRVGPLSMSAGVGVRRRAPSSRSVLCSCSGLAESPSGGEGGRTTIQSSSRGLLAAVLQPPAVTETRHLRKRAVKA